MKRKTIHHEISIQDFVKNYLGTAHNCYKLKHQGLKSFENPYVVGVSNDYALRNPDSVNRGEILVVIDDFGKTGSYLNPDYISKLIELETEKQKLKQFEDIHIHNLSQISDYFKLINSTQVRINTLQAIYKPSSELLTILGKKKLLREIKNHAKQEASIKNLVFNPVEESTITENIDYSTYESDQEVKIEENDSVIEYLEDYFPTVNINRNKVKRRYY